MSAADAPKLKSAPRTETDAFGQIDVPGDRYWGAQTQRSIKNFPIGWEKQPVAIVRALGVIKGYYDYGMFQAIQVAAIVALRHTEAAVEAYRSRQPARLGSSGQVIR